MKAAVLSAYGNEEQIQYIKEYDKPIPKEYELLVKVKACALSDLDLQVRKGYFKELIQLPIIVGYDVSGTIEDIGRHVTQFKIGDEVVGMCSIDSQLGGCSEYTLLNSFNCVIRPPLIQPETAVTGLREGLRAYTALQYSAKMTAGDTILVLNGADATGHIAIQLASIWGAKVITTAATNEEVNYLQDMKIKITKIIDTSSDNLVDCVLEETGGFGVDCVIDTNFSPTSVLPIDKDTDENFQFLSKRKYEILRCLGINGRWVTSTYNLQLDPTDSRALFLKGASISYLFEHTWILSNAQQGRFLHILTDLMEKIAQEKVQLKLFKTFPLEKIREAYRTLDTNKIGKIVIKL